MYSFLVIVLHFIIIYSLKVIYVCRTFMYGGNTKQSTLRIEAFHVRGFNQQMTAIKIGNPWIEANSTSHFI